MKAILNKFSFEKLKSFTKKIVYFDIAINITVGISLLSAPNLFYNLLFNAQILPIWLFIVIGVGLLIFAFWQLAFFIRPGRFTLRNLRFAAVLAWIPFFGLTIGLLTDLSDQLLILPKIFLWTANIYMLLLGGLYWGNAAKAKESL